MKTFGTYLAGVLTCLALVSIVVAQGPQGSGKRSSDSLPQPVCAALAAYVASVDAAKAQPDKTKRAEQYSEAKAALEGVLKRYDRSSLFAEAAPYADYMEEVVSREVTDLRLPEFVEKRLKTRDYLLGLCLD